MDDDATESRFASYTIMSGGGVGGGLAFPIQYRPQVPGMKRCF
jgi:hypothetical protein